MRKKSCLILILVVFISALAGMFVLNVSFMPKVPFKLGLDLQGGSHLIYEADLSGVENQDREPIMRGLRDVIERRVNLFGVREPVVQIEESDDSYRLIIELAGIKNVSEAIDMIGQTPFLEFKEEKPNFEEIIEHNQKVNETGEGEEIEPFQSTTLTGKYLEKARLDFNDMTGEPFVSLQFDDEGSKLFEELTENNIDKYMPIYIDGNPISLPKVREKISGGRAQITGIVNVQEAKNLAENLNAGALPVPINMISQQTVGSTLGAVSVERSLKAGILGFLAVIIFMILVYRLPGFLASISLLIYITLVLTIFKMIPVTLTLAGIAGFILSIGMAVDANVLIFSRMREERKEGKEFPLVIRDGFARAWPSIRDSNITTLIVALILFSFGTSFVKGFAFTLSLGILVSLFSAIFVTRSFLRCFIGTRFEKIKFLWK